VCEGMKQSDFLHNHVCINDKWGVEFSGAQCPITARYQYGEGSILQMFKKREEKCERVLLLNLILNV
jgi:hypothetical protein